jgi:hypothetical protein
MSQGNKSLCLSLLIEFRIKANQQTVEMNQLRTKISQLEAALTEKDNTISKLRSEYTSTTGSSFTLILFFMTNV